MRKLISILLLAVMMVSLLTGCCLSHDWKDATCTTPKVCAKCGKAEGEALGHNWETSIFYDLKECLTCGEKDMTSMLPSLASTYNATYNSDTNELVIETGPIGNEYSSFWEYWDANPNANDDDIRNIGYALGLSLDQVNNLMKTKKTDGVKTITGSYSNTSQILSVTAEYTDKDRLRITFCVK